MSPELLGASPCWRYGPSQGQSSSVSVCLGAASTEEVEDFCLSFVATWPTPSHWPTHLLRSSLKYFLSLSKEGKKNSLLARLDDPRSWQLSTAEIHEREYWDDYVHAYER